MTAHADTLSLRLSDWRSAIKRRVRRPKRPGPLEILYWCLAVLGVFSWVTNAVEGRTVDAILDSVATVACVKAALALRGGDYLGGLAWALVLVANGVTALACGVLGIG